MSRVTLRAVNAALLRAGRTVQLARGKGYFYIYGDQGELPHYVKTTMILTPRLSTYTVAGWLREVENLLAIP